MQNDIVDKTIERFSDYLHEIIQRGDNKTLALFEGFLGMLTYEEKKEILENSLLKGEH